jgi:hypothetical protein
MAFSCGVLGFSPQAFYNWRSAETGFPQRPDLGPTGTSFWEGVFGEARRRGGGISFSISIDVDASTRRRALNEPPEFAP